MEEVTDEPLYRDRVCGIDIGKAGMVATIRVPSDKDPARRAAETRSFGTTKKEVLALADWLRCWQVPAVVMEATGDYWKGPFYRLEAEGFECVLADAKQVKNLPGRPKRDPSDSRWLAACFERGAVTACFVATPEFRVIRLHTRYRRDLTEERTREKQRAEKLLESAAIKLSSRGHRPARGDRPGHHGPPDRRGAQPQGAGPAGPRPRPPQDRRAGRGAGGRGVLHRRARRPAGGHAGPHRPGQRRDRPADRGDRAAAGPLRGAAAAGRVDARLGAPRRPGRPRRDRRGHDQVPHRRRTWPPGPAAPRWTTSPASAQGRPSPRRATGTWPPSPARPPSRPARPRPAKAPATGGWPAAAARPKPRSPSATPS